MWFVFRRTESSEGRSVTRRRSQEPLYRHPVHVLPLTNASFFLIMSLFFFTFPFCVAVFFDIIIIIVIMVVVVVDVVLIWNCLGTGWLRVSH